MAYKIKIKKEVFKYIKVTNSIHLLFNVFMVKLKASKIKQKQKI